MTGIKIQLGAIAAAFIALGYAMPLPATATSASAQVTSDVTDFSARRAAEAAREPEAVAETSTSTGTLIAMST